MWKPLSELLSFLRLSNIPYCICVCVWLVHQAPLSMRFSRQEYWSGLPFSSPVNLPNSGIKPRSPTLQADSLWTELHRKPISISTYISIYMYMYTYVYVCIHTHTYIYITYMNIQFFFHWSKDTWIASTSWFLQVILLWTWV